MSNYANAIILGRLVRDWEVRKTGTGKTVANNTIAVNHKKDDGGHFISLTAWDKGAELLAQYSGKGDRLFVRGDIVEEKWPDKESGKQRSKLVVVVDKFQLIERKGDRDESRTAAPRTDPPARPANSDPHMPLPEDDIPL